MIRTALARLTAVCVAVFTLGFVAACADDSSPTSPESTTGALALASSSATISGTTGVIVDANATNGQFYMRYVGDPAPAGYAHFYQWGTPRIVTPSPDVSPITLSGTIDIDDQFVGQVSMIGLIDLTLLDAGVSSGHQTGAYMYIHRQSAAQWRIGVSDGNAGGEIVQTFITVLATDLPADGVLDVVLTIDGTADGLACATGGAIAPAGCVTLDISGGSVNATLTDSYGDRIGTGSASPEFSNGAIPGWDDFQAANVTYDLTVSPIVVLEPQTKDDCKKGGWEQYGFRNQGQCIKFVNTGKDSR